MKKRIKSCPFCGAIARKPRLSTEYKWYIDHSLMCWMGRGRTQVFEPKEVPYWNRRAKGSK